MGHHAQLTAVAVACVLALVSCGSQDGDATSEEGDRTTTATDPSRPDGGSGRTTTEPSSTTIPDDFPLSAGMAAPEDEIATSRTGTGLRDLELCGAAPLRGLGLRDRMVADNSGGEAIDTRELVLLGSPEEAAELAQSFSDLAADCDDRGPAQGFETLTEVRGSSFGSSPAVTLLQTYELEGEPVAGTMVIHVVPAGAALLVASTYGEWAPGDLDEGVAGTAEAVRRTVAALDDFGGAGSSPTSSPTSSLTSSPSSTPGNTPSDEASPAPTGPSGTSEPMGPADPTETTGTTEPTESPESPQPPPEPTGTTKTPEPTPANGPTEIPGDFPLGAGLPQDGGDIEVEEQSAEGEGVGAVEMCGRDVWPIDGTAGGTRRLATGALGPEYFDGRELLVHADAEVALDAMAAIRRAARSCRASGHQVWTALDRDTGYDTVTMGLTYDDGLGSSVFQVTRVGAARLMVQTYGEGSIDSLDAQADEVTATTSQIVAAMCVFTRTGC